MPVNGPNIPAESPPRVSFSTRGYTCVCDPAFSETVQSVYDDGSWVYDHLRNHRGSRRKRGRIPVVQGRLNGVDVLVKRFTHGGFLAPLTRDRFVHPGRFIAGMAASDYLLARNVITPRVLFTTHRRTNMVVRGETGLEYFQGTDASDFFFAGEQSRADGWRDAAARMADLVARLHAVDFHHPDLNLMNIFFLPGGTAAILDLDKARVPVRSISAEIRYRNIQRLCRSIRKQGQKHDSGYVAEIQSILRAVYDEQTDRLS